MDSFNEIQSLLQDKADIQARIKLIPYDGNPEVKENVSGKYLYIRKRVGSRLTSTYVDVYSENLYQLLLRNAKELRNLKKTLRKIEKRLAELGYEANGLSNRVLQNLDFARANMKSNIYDQAILEGVATSYPQTEDIIDNGTVNGMTANDIQKILNLKHAWEFILDTDVAQANTDYYLLCHIARLVNEGFFNDGGKIRGVPVKIGGSKYIPPIPIELIVKERITEKGLEEKENEVKIHSIPFKDILLLAIATSIDALAVGVSFAFLKVNLWIATTTIGITTFVLSFICVLFGKTLGNLFEKYAEYMGGSILILLGIKILIEHLFF